jgi:hypothetical protein
MGEPMNDATNDGPVAISFPQYAGIPTADKKQAGILNKVISKMLKPKAKPLSSRSGRKGLQSRQSVTIKHKKRNYY